MPRAATCWRTSCGYCPSSCSARLPCVRSERVPGRGQTVTLASSQGGTARAGAASRAAASWDHPCVVLIRTCPTCSVASAARCRGAGVGIRRLQPYDSGCELNSTPLPPRPPRPRRLALAVSQAGLQQRPTSPALTLQTSPRVCLRLQGSPYRLGSSSLVRGCSHLDISITQSPCKPRQLT
jgi:hypothetical protein